MNSMDLKYLKSNLLLTLDVLVLLNSSGVLVGIFGRKLYDHGKKGEQVRFTKCSLLGLISNEKHPNVLDHKTLDRSILVVQRALTGVLDLCKLLICQFTTYQLPRFFNSHAKMIGACAY